MGRQNPSDKNRVYRLSLIDNNTHKQIKAIRFTKARFIQGCVVVGVSIILLLYCLIAFTPIRKTIPGYPDAYSKKLSLNNAMKIDSLENMLNRWHLYALGMQEVLSGRSELTQEELVQSGGAANFLSDKGREQLAEQDQLLRESIQKAQQFTISPSNANRSLPIEGKHFFTPVKGVISNPWDGVEHPGVDIATTSGSIVSSVLDGMVIFSGWDEDFGHILIVQHDDNIISIYKKNQRALVKVGDEIKAGTPIAIVGTAPNSPNEEHLHFELWLSGANLDPTKYISF